LAGGLNPYIYAGNNPINATDPSGTDWLDNTSDFFAGWGDGLTIGATRQSGEQSYQRIVGAIGARKDRGDKHG
jgi:methionine salvage enolase-phosphatase E1